MSLYLLNGKSREAKEKDRQTLLLAESIAAKRTVDIRNGEWGFNTDTSDTPFFGYFRRQCERRRNNIGTHRAWQACLLHIETFERRRDITFADITPQWCARFLDYLTDEAVKEIGGNRLCSNTAVAYFAKFRACLNAAVADGIIERSPAAKVKPPRLQEGRRMYLTIEELRRLINTDCSNDTVRRAFLFSCLTGLRASDVFRLRWGDIHEQGGYTRIIFRQKKTDGQEYMDITPQAVILMGERGLPDSNVFQHMSHESYNTAIRRWVSSAGIGKHITFHCARHTFATMMLELGTDIYTVSKLLGHRDLSTTQIYARILDKSKQDAVDRIPSLITDSATDAQQICNRNKTKETQMMQTDETAQ